MRYMKTFEKVGMAALIALVIIAGIAVSLLLPVLWWHELWIIPTSVALILFIIHVFSELAFGRELVEQHFRGKEHIDTII
jgi:hypothetical protein